MQTVLVTGASGFVGQGLCHELVRKGVKVHAVVRDQSRAPLGTQSIIIKDLREPVEWDAMLQGIDVVFHLAGLAHQVRHGKTTTSATQLDVMRTYNVTPTRYLAQASARVGVKRFVYVSSVKVNGDRTVHTPYGEEDSPAPEDAYGQSKFEAEQAVRETDLDWVVVRPPLVYGPGVKGNFLSLLKMCGSAMPLPFARLDNQRSFVYLPNLIDGLLTCATHPQAARQTFLVCDGQDVSVSTLIRMVRQAMLRPARLWHIPPVVLKILLSSLGRAEAWQRLAGSLQVNDQKIRNMLEWKPPYGLREGLQQTVQWYLQVVSTRESGVN